MKIIIAALAAVLAVAGPARADYGSWWAHTTPHYSQQYFGGGWYGSGYSSHGMSHYRITGPRGRSLYCTTTYYGTHCN